MSEDDSHLLIDESALEIAEEIKRDDACDKCGEPYLEDLGGDNGWTLICSNSECKHELDLVQYVSDRYYDNDD